MRPWPDLRNIKLCLHVAALLCCRLPASPPPPPAASRSPIATALVQWRFAKSGNTRRARTCSLEKRLSSDLSARLLKISRQISASNRLPSSPFRKRARPTSLDYLRTPIFARSMPSVWLSCQRIYSSHAEFAESAPKMAAILDRSSFIPYFLAISEDMKPLSMLVASGSSVILGQWRIWMNTVQSLKPTISFAPVLITCMSDVPVLQDN